MAPLEAHLHVTGSAEDPHPAGTLQIANGGMAVEPTGVTYSNIAGKIDLQPDRVHVEQITVLDNHQSSLSVTGDLARPRSRTGRLPDLGQRRRLQSHRQQDGQRPHPDGDVAVRPAAIAHRPGISRRDDRSGQPRRDHRAHRRLTVRDRGAKGDSGNTTAVIAEATPAPPPASLFDALRMNLSFTVPNDLVHQGQQPADARFARRSRCTEHHAWRRPDRDQGPGVARFPRRIREYHPRQLRLSGPPVRDPAGRHDPLRRSRAVQPDASTSARAASFRVSRPA